MLNDSEYQEEFIKRLVKAGHQRASQQNRNMVRYHDMGKLVPCVCTRNLICCLRSQRCEGSI